VSLEGEGVLSERHRCYGGELIRIDIARATALGAFRSMQPRLPVTQWRVVKP
jgi:precorrin-6Y C5,15-methyltransferase (decarboxylating)